MDETHWQDGMRTFQAEVTIPADWSLMIELLEDIEVGSYQVVVVMNPSLEIRPSVQSEHGLNALLGRVRSFAGIDAVSWQRQVRAAWDDN